MRLLLRGIRHDFSKYGKHEEPYFRKYQPLLKNCVYGSDQYKQYLKELSVALEHHYGNNDHHPEHFENGYARMPLLARIEMLCDWKAATKRHRDGDIMRSIEGNAGRFGYDEKEKEIIVETAKEIGLV